MQWAEYKPNFLAY